MLDKRILVSDSRGWGYACGVRGGSVRTRGVKDPRQFGKAECDMRIDSCHHVHKSFYFNALRRSLWLENCSRKAAE